MGRNLILSVIILALFTFSFINVAISLSSAENDKAVNAGVYISVPFHYQSNNYYCGPAALEMVFDYYGEDVPQLEIADVARTYPFSTYTDEMVRAVHFSNLSTSLGDEMSGNITGYSARKIGYAAFERGGLTIDDLKFVLDEGDPLIVLMWWTPAKNYGHYRVVVGYNDTYIFTNDPWNKKSWGGIYGGANTSMTYPTFLDLWEYSSYWGLWVHPWDIKLEVPSTVQVCDDFEVTANITYTCSPPFDTGLYAASSCNATLELQEGIELTIGETAQHSLGFIGVGTSVLTSWQLHANPTGLYNISVTAKGIVEGSVWEHGTCPSYDYKDAIGGLAGDSIPVVNKTCKVHNVDTGLNYTTIQVAINAPETLNGHTIFLDAGTYYEHLTVDKSLSLIGEDANNTIVDGGLTGSVLHIITDNVRVTNLTIRRSGKELGPGFPDSCILASNVANVRIENNTIYNGAVGVLGYASCNITMHHNIVKNCGLMGIHLDGNSSFCKILDNKVEDNLEGMELERSFENIVERNILKENNVSIVLNQCNGVNVFRSNNMSSDWYNLIVWGSSLKPFMQNIESSNIVNGKTVYYLMNFNNAHINPSNYSNIGFFALVNCTNITVRDIDLSLNKDGMLLAQSEKCILKNITLRGNLGPLLYGGLTFFRSNNNHVICNKISNNSVGIALHESDDNVFYYNSLICNTRQVVPNFLSPFSESSGSYSVNKWDDDIEGNYWSNYKGKDADHDGIGDSLYCVTPPGSTPPELVQYDYHPLMGIFQSFNTSRGYTVNVISNSTIDDFEYFESNSTIRMHVSNTTLNQAFGFCRICVSHDLVFEPFNVTINGANPIYWNYTLFDNGTHRWVYFSYKHSTVEIVIVPEFSSPIVLPLLITAIILVAIIFRRNIIPNVH